MEDTGKKYKLVYRDGEVLKMRRGYGFEFLQETNPWLLKFFTDDDKYGRQELVINTNTLISIESQS